MCTFTRLFAKNTSVVCRFEPKRIDTMLNNLQVIDKYRHKCPTIFSKYLHTMPPTPFPNQNNTNITGTKPSTAVETMLQTRVLEGGGVNKLSKTIRRPPLKHEFGVWFQQP